MENNISVNEIMNAVETWVGARNDCVIVRDEYEDNLIQDPPDYIDTRDKLIEWREESGYNFSRNIILRTEEIFSNIHFPTTQMLFNYFRQRGNAQMMNNEIVKSALSILITASEQRSRMVHDIEAIYNLLEYLDEQNNVAGGKRKVSKNKRGKKKRVKRKP
mgnify:CR=1 FL=1